jgi:hypothetical protein
MVVPRRLGAAPTFSSGEVGWPRAKLCRNSSRLRATSTTVSTDSALTTLTPTPCRPPLVA